MKKGTYSSTLDCTCQFKFCGNPLRIDMYKGCTFGCNYCFANSRRLKGNFGADNKFDWADINKIENYFKRANEEKDIKDLNIEMLKNKVPLHCGGMSDPFQPREFQLHLTYKLIELSNKYQHPIIFSTKAAELPEEYYKILDPKLHAFQVSICGWDDEFIRKYETQTPTAAERVNFLKTLHDKGFWTALRIQPLIDLEQAKKITNKVVELKCVDYITVEHLKIPLDNPAIMGLFKDVYSLEKFTPPANSKAGGRGTSFKPSVKIDNFKVICDIANPAGIKVGAGDNDIHFLSQSRCCCGIDTIPGGAFDNYMKYNLTYFLTSNDVNEFDNVWLPSSNYHMAFLKKGKQRAISYKNYVDEFIRKHPKLIPENRKDLRRKFNLGVSNTLFKLEDFVDIEQEDSENWNV